MRFIKSEISGQMVTIAFDENSIHIFNGFNIKDELKLRGYRFNTEEKSWDITTADVGSELEILKNNFRSGLDPDTKKNEIKYGIENENGFPQSYSVSELRNKIEKILRKEIPGKIWIRGIIASEVKRYKWFSYFNIKDEKNENLYFNVECKNIFLNKIEQKLAEFKITEKLEKNLPVFLGAEVKISGRNLVDVRLNLVDIFPEFTLAKLRSQREVTVERLIKEDQFYNQKKLKLPMFIENIGLISSENGTSVKDITSGMDPFSDKYNFFFIDSRMEGENAVDSIIKSIDFFEKHKDLKIDLLIIARGGGSEQSLSVFNDYGLCYRVCLSKLPVMTAIGHEKDLSAIEMCSYLSPVPATPSGIGKYLAQRFFKLELTLIEKFRKTVNVFREIQNVENAKVSAFLRHVPSISFNVIKMNKNDLGNLIVKYDSMAEIQLRGKKNILNISVKILLDKVKINVKSGFDLINTKWEDLKTVKTMVIMRKIYSFFELVKRADFKRIEKVGIANQKKLVEKYRVLYELSILRMERTEKIVKMYEKLANSKNPEEILKKGFTLVLDKRDRIISSLSKFLKTDKKRLKFFDGEIEIDKKETK